MLPPCVDFFAPGFCLRVDAPAPDFFPAGVCDGDDLRAETAVGMLFFTAACVRVGSADCD